VKSRNFRIELHAAAGLPYPGEGRPIGAFVRTSPREFLYMLLMPGTSHYPRVAAIVAQLAKSPANQLKRVRLTASELRRLWPRSPLWRYTDGFHVTVGREPGSGYPKR
jgi:hypothetical protein